jgi:hypothetical protein
MIGRGISTTFELRGILRVPLMTSIDDEPLTARRGSADATVFLNTMALGTVANTRGTLPAGSTGNPVSCGSWME